MTAYDLRPIRDPLLKHWSQLPDELLFLVYGLTLGPRHRYDTRHSVYRPIATGRRTRSRSQTHERMCRRDGPDAPLNSACTSLQWH